MQFQVPQFIEVEDKIFGPLTFKQFLYFAGGAGLSFVCWRYLPLLVAAPIILGVMGISAALALGQWNGRPFILGLESGFYYLVTSKLYLWSHDRKKKKQKVEIENQVANRSEVYVPKLSESKLHQLAWSLDIQEKINTAQRMRDVPEEASQTIAPTNDTIRTMRTARDALVQ